ncbi:E3 ubiquitin-protein ligase MIB2 [Rhipicephalus sanguineus]|uniref:E3 ubiquitin-protein ligase MIB2 n=1 Tax=Rhipicephalus sanguineus TaxID=34632 RepID=UPI0018942B24|nr:E3 ubiquitin-protein ligase MIB2 [Rhipicephalus sanguineus]
MGSSSSTPSSEDTTPPQRPNAGGQSGSAGSQTAERVSITVNLGTSQPSFSPGDLVKVIDDLTKLKILQRGHGEYVDAMARCVGQVGAVIKVFPSRDVRVIFSGSIWTFNPLCLTAVRQSTGSDTSARLRSLARGRDISDEIAEQLMRAFTTSLGDSLGLSTSGSKKASKFSVGQKVKISGNKTRVKILQIGHGGYTAGMDSELGRIGTIASIDSDGDLTVKFRNGRNWCFNPDLAEAVSDDESESSDSDIEVPATLRRMMRDLFGIASTEDSGGPMVKSELTPLLVACHEGDESLVRMMMTTGADMNEKDKDGDSALHFGAYGNKPDILELLVNFGADINAKNKKGYTALHVAVNKEFVACVRVLTNYISDLDVNTQDEYGDTPLHDAIRTGNNDIVDLLVNFQTVDFAVKNKRGFNVFHHAALKGNVHAMERLLSKKPELVDSKKGDGYTSLHLAAVNNHYSLAKLLLTKGRCTVDIKNSLQQTALLLAVHQGHCELTELLVEAGADINQPDNDGDTPMHMSLMKRTNVKVAAVSSSKAPIIRRIVNDLPSSESNLALACFLASRGGDLHKKNKKGLTPLAIAGDLKSVERLLKWKTATSVHATSSPERSSGGATAGGTSEDGKCKVCLDAPASVWFEPCGHRLYCPDCCRRMKCCLSCGERITGKVSDGEKPADSEAQRELEAKLRRLEEAHTCIICMERERNVAFMCGHAACDRCAANLSVCHMCRIPIDKKITLF